VVAVLNRFNAPFPMYALPWLAISFSALLALSNFLGLNCSSVNKLGQKSIAVFNTGVIFVALAR
jgi:hypothetical protein